MAIQERRTKRRNVFFTAAAILVVFSPLLFTELMLRMFLPPLSESINDNHLVFQGLRPLFVLNRKTGQYETAKNRLQCFRPQSFSSPKQDNTFRIFCLGGSTVQGRPYSFETSFTTWLRLNLQTTEPDRHWEVINCGGVSYASYRLLPILKEVLHYQPDLIVIYSGHNEFLEDRSIRSIKSIPVAITRIHEALLHLYSYSYAYHYLKQFRHPSNEKALPVEVQAKLDYEDGLALYHRDDRWRNGIIDDYRRNIVSMVKMCRKNDVPLILAKPVSNLKDCPPFKSVRDAGLSSRENQRLDELEAKIESTSWRNAYRKIALLERAVKIDSRHAGYLFQLGKCYETLGRLDKAKEWYIRAKEEDICPLRILSPMSASLDRIAEEYQVPLVDVEGWFASHSPGRIPGNKWLMDHVHPTIDGHRHIADLLFEEMQAQHFVGQKDLALSTRNRLWKQYYDSLNESYFVHGSFRLERLLTWCRRIKPVEHK